MFDYEKLKRLLMEDGLEQKQYSLFMSQMKRNFYSIHCSEDLETYAWALKKGFFPDQVEKYGLTGENIEDYFSTYAYFKMYPLNDFFRIWINDKLTMKYFLSGAGLRAVLPKCYLYIENRGRHIYLVDAPEDIPHNETFLWELLKRERVIAAKPNNGHSSKGFIKYEYKDTCVLANNVKISKEQYLEEASKLYNYIFIEYLFQHDGLKKVFEGTEAVVRCNMYKAVQSELYSESVWEFANGYLTLGTAKSGTASNETRDAICVPIDYDSGMLFEAGLYHRDEQGALEKVYAHSDTGFVFKNFMIPEWKMLKDVVLKACKALQSLDWLGFDVIITDSGPKIIEINSLLGIEMPQMLSGPILKDDELKKFLVSKGLENSSVENFYKIIKECYVL